MAQVTIDAAHVPMRDLLTNTQNTRSAAAGADTGPFREFRDTYVFAAAVGLCLHRAGQTPAPAEAAGGGAATIKREIFEGAPGAAELVALAALVGPADPIGGDDLDARLLALAAEDQSATLKTLDSFAARGFDWLVDENRDQADIRGLVLAAIENFV